MARIRSKRWLVAVACLLFNGCGRAPPRLEPPAIDAKSAGRAAIAEYDTNGDGVISGDEVDACPALKAAIKKFDHGTSKITAADITERIEAWQHGRVCMSPMAVQLTLDGKPLDGAMVSAEPEKFLGSGVPSANGVTNSQGTAWLQVAPSKPGVFYGLYKLRVSKTIDARETIPARYNTHTEFGFEKAPDTPTFGGLKFALKSM